MSSSLPAILWSSWKSEDLAYMCAFLNTNGGSLSYTYPSCDESFFDRQLKLIRNKIKKIQPSVEKHLFISTKRDPKHCSILVSIKPSPSICFIISRSDKQSYYYLTNGRPVKTDLEYIQRIRQRLATKSHIAKITPMMTIPDAKYIESYEFTSGNIVPIFEAFSVYGFNRLVGYLKYINRKYANVYSRGECKLHPSLIPSLYRGSSDLHADDKKIETISKRFFSDPKISETLSLNILEPENSRYRIEGVLQHYGASTSFLDVVDNHWVALWMGLNDYIVKEQIEKYASFVERSIPSIERISGENEYQDPKKWVELLYQYVLLIAVPYSDSNTNNGIGISDSVIEVDLRKALPSTFLRPHAQHGLVIKKNVSNSSPSAIDFDLSSNVVGIIRIRIDRAKRWIGDGELLTQDNLIPPPGYDPGYDLLLNKSELFRNSSLKITKYE